jgi:hypothetical protein
MGLRRNVYKEAQKVERILENKKFHFCGFRRALCFVWK